MPIIIRKPFLITTYISAILFLSGCAGVSDNLFQRQNQLSDVAGYSVGGREIEYSVFDGGSPRRSSAKPPRRLSGEKPGKDTIFILGAIHGHEPAGAVLAKSLEKYLMENPQVFKKHRVVILPVANPDGLATNTRTNLNGVDLNRNFPADNRKNISKFGMYGLSEPEASAIYHLIARFEPDRIVSIHQPLKCIDYDGPAKELAEAMAMHCDLPVKKIGAMPGSLGSYAGVTLGIPIITLELPKEAANLDSESLWQKYGPTLIAAIEK
ncbi:MAG: DUF2817 domain-containing protein [Sedimentisphaerales bacterium]|nr:DUF2817 domain-containing protein [Sedimentisphaerales bacterium]